MIRSGVIKNGTSRFVSVISSHGDFRAFLSYPRLHFFMFWFVAWRELTITYYTNTSSCPYEFQWDACTYCKSLSFANSSVVNLMRKWIRQLDCSNGNAAEPFSVDIETFNKRRLSAFKRMIKPFSLVLPGFNAADEPFLSFVFVTNQLRFDGLNIRRCTFVIRKSKSRCIRRASRNFCRSNCFWFHLDYWQQIFVLCKSWYIRLSEKFVSFYKEIQ